MASLAYCYHTALMKVSRSLCLRHLYAPDVTNFNSEYWCPPQENFSKFDVLKSHSDAFWALKCEFIITMYQIFINVSTDFCTILHGYYYEDQLLTVFTPKLRFGNDFNLGWLGLSPIAISYTVPLASVEPCTSSLTQVI